MIVTLPSEIEKIVVEKVSSGAYQSAAEVISESVRLLEAKEKGTEVLRREIMRHRDFEAQVSQTAGLDHRRVQCCFLPATRQC